MWTAVFSPCGDEGQEDQDGRRKGRHDPGVAGQLRAVYCYAYRKLNKLLLMVQFLCNSETLLKLGAVWKQH